MRPLIILFAKAPIAGRVKTRLTPRLTPEQAAGLHRVLVADAWAQLGALGDLELHTDEPTGAWPDAHPRRLQSGGDLGERMLHAIGEALKERPRAMIVAADAPAIPSDHLRGLLEADADVAIGPAEDGGYYAIACRRADPRMFARVRWSTRHALVDSIAAIAACGLSVAVGQQWHDIDTPEDLDRVPAVLLRAAGIAHP